jgi:effector-binding domain-containing protein
VESLKPGDKVRLKRLDNWVTPQDSVMTVKHIGEFPHLGLSRGALCEWIDAMGGAH